MADIIKTGNRANWISQGRIKLIGEDSANILPDTFFNTWVETADRLMKKRVTNWSTVLSGGGDDKEFLIDAAICYLCGMLVTPLRNLVATDEKIGDLAVKKSLDFEKLEADLYGEVDALLSYISTYTATTVSRCGVISQPTTFESLNT